MCIRDRHESGLINKIINTVSQVGLTVRGMYGEGSEPAGCVYQVSNQITLGISEKDTIERLEEMCIRDRRRYYRG